MIPFSSSMNTNTGLQNKKRFNHDIVGNVSTGLVISNGRIWCD